MFEIELFVRIKMDLAFNNQNGWYAVKPNQTKPNLELSILKFGTKRLLLVTWNHMIIYKLLVLDKNICNYTTVCKQMTIIKYEQLF